VVIPAGIAGPRQLTDWKFRAIKLAAKGVLEGGLTSLDFEEAKIGMTIWRQRGWIQAIGWTTIEGKRYRTYEVCQLKRFKPPHIANPEIVEALVREGIVK
jgi:hypothetical protein